MEASKAVAYRKKPSDGFRRFLTSFDGFWRLLTAFDGFSLFHSLHVNQRKETLPLTFGRYSFLVTWYSAELSLNSSQDFSYSTDTDQNCYARRKNCPSSVKYQCLPVESCPLPVEISPPWSSLLLQEGQFLKKNLSQRPCGEPVDNKPGFPLGKV